MTIAFDKDKNVALLGGESLVFHCHFYNVALQKAVADGLGDAARTLQIDAAASTIHAQLSALVAPPGHGNDPLARRDEVRATASATFARLGFGTMDLAALSSTGGTIVLGASHYGLGWFSVHGGSDSPVCHFATGFAKAILAVSEGLSLDRIDASERACVACGADHCEIVLAVLPLAGADTSPCDATMATTAATGEVKR